MESLTDRTHGEAGERGVVGTLNARDMALSKMCWSELLCVHPTVTLSSNSLSGSGLDMLLLCKQLTLDNNPLTTLEPVSQLPCLQRLSIKECGLKTSAALLPLLKLTTLQHLNASSNFVDDQEEAINQIRKHFSHLHELVI